MRSPRLPLLAHRSLLIQRLPRPNLPKLIMLPSHRLPLLVHLSLLIQLPLRLLQQVHPR